MQDHESERFRIVLDTSLDSVVFENARQFGAMAEDYPRQDALALALLKFLVYLPYATREIFRDLIYEMEDYPGNIYAFMAHKRPAWDAQLNPPTSPLTPEDQAEYDAILAQLKAKEEQNHDENR